MIEKAIKQRLVGGLVLIAGAVLFLPVLLDGSGAELVVPPMPQPPKVVGLKDVQPRLEGEVAAATASVDQAQAGPEFHDVTPPDAAPVVEDTPPDDAYALAQSPATPVPAATPTASDKQAQARLEAEKAAASEAARLAAQKAETERLARERLEKERLARLEAEKKAQEAKLKAAQAQAKPVATSPARPAADLPQAWVVQVASLSAREKADELVSRLRAKGFRATVVHQSGNWKVLVGPELRKEVAESVRQRLASDPELKLSGWVQAWKP